ncbi:MAG: HAMP domain-containing sensor histidine kinase [Candidatus Pseudobacter hemicellulosilyticus]|uniref:histidine kinase n=1 Tax=Candidatus Pseudobacter hemicellulosilyticus TaxID=3121375 RepID=A0AAJ5WW15_9BACT|nr:MAG: HAMP domain-containing sensor histidine kinase [Pseudobacter sp.]
MKIKYKITALFILLVTAILLLLSISVYYFTALDRSEAFKKRLMGRANNNAQIFSIFGDSSASVLSQIDSGSVGTLPRKSVIIYDYLDHPLYIFNAPGQETPDISRAILERARVEHELYFHLGDREALAFHHTDPASRIVIVVAAYDEDGWSRLTDLKRILFTSLLIGLAIALIGGYLFSIQLVKPLSLIIREVKDISSQNLSHRIEAGSGHDELHQLANTFNELLNRLQDSFNSQRRFISNASHELSTPLTSISSQLEVTLHKHRSTEEYQQVLLSVREDVKQMQSLTRSLLEIAKTGSQGAIELNEVRIDEILFKVMGDVRKISADYRVEVQFGDFPEDEKEFMVFGNSDLLYMSIKNFVENGCKYSPDHQSWLDLSFESGLIIIRVKNEGDVIAEEEMEHIFLPFYRTSSAAQKSKGFGLGLPLAQRIIGLHKGSIEVQSDIVTGTVFTITLPSILAFSR